MAVLSNMSMTTVSSCLMFYLLSTCFVLACLVSSSFGDLQRFEQPIKDDGSVSFLVVGDWGRKGLYNQSHVAYQMGRIGEMQDIDFVISTGDNFYDDGLKGVDDPAFQESFMNIYTAPSLQKQWYTVLGNHDYRGDVEAQLSPILTQLDSKWLCLRSYVVAAEIVDFFFVDTSPFVESYFTKPEPGQTYDWRGVTPQKSYIARQLEENNVDLYLNGHDHCLQHITSTKGSGKLEFVTSGGGSKAWNGYIQKEKDGLKFFHDGQGFVSMEVTPKVAKIVFYDVFGQVLYHFHMYKELVQLHFFS
ncbi:hypothetical protein MKW94_003934 [Papaver nudicaule]|uniref:Purple acid phosphatase n=1 Tax=Papaver nudicaule TaxID=74823 RepID=A0AA42AYM5_PAPNU|nr:hypothetical protein [Papaver nudicaule]